MITSGQATTEHGVRAVLRVPAFRRLWVALSLSSMGDWLGLLAMTAMAAAITDTFTAANYAIGGVLVLKMLPALLFGPLGGALADRFDRRYTMVVADVLRFGLFVSIPIVGQLGWLLAASFLIECVTLFWIPSKEATVPNLVPRKRLEAANRLSVFTTYGSAPVAALVFVLLAVLSNVLATSVTFFRANPVDLALYFNALMFLVSAAVIFFLRAIPRRDTDYRVSVPSVFRSILEGWASAFHTRMVRGLTVGMLGAFAAGGAVLGVARVHVAALGGGNAAYGALFGAVFLGMAVGMFLGPRVIRDFSRRRLFGLAIISTGVVLVFVGVVPNLPVVVMLTLALGVFAGIAWVTGYTLVGLEVEDSERGRTFAFLQSLVRVVLMLVLAAVPFASGAIGVHAFPIGELATLRMDGSNVMLLAAAVVCVLVGIVSLRLMDDRREVPLLADLMAAVRGVPHTVESERPGGVLIAFEGGEGSGKTTQTRALAVWLRDQGYDVVTTHEPGATKAGMRLRAILLDKSNQGMSSRSEALMYAADRAEHVDAIIRPALERGAIVITDRFVDSSLAYQGAGRSLPAEEVARLNQWATGDLMPDLTIVLDVPASVGLGRFASPADRMESESMDFHERVRRTFRTLAQEQPERYLVVDASATVEEIAERIQDRARQVLPDPVPDASEDVTHVFPAIRPDQGLTQRSSKKSKRTQRSSKKFEATQRSSKKSKSTQRSPRKSEATQRASEKPTSTQQFTQEGGQQSTQEFARPSDQHPDQQSTPRFTRDAGQQPSRKPDQQSTQEFARPSDQHPDQHPDQKSTQEFAQPSDGDARR